MEQSGGVWRVIVAVGKVALPVGALLAVVGFGLVQLGIPEGGYLYIGTLLLFLLKVVALIYENNAQGQANSAHRQAEQERLRGDLVKALTEQAGRVEKEQPPQQ